MRYFLLSLTILALFPAPAIAKDRPPIIEIFTYSSGGSCGLQGEDEFHNADGSHKDGIEDQHNHDEISTISALDTFKNIIKENPDAIALQYYNNAAGLPHVHDKNGNDIIDKNAIIEPVNPELIKFIEDRNYLYYRNQNALERFGSFEIVIDGQYKTKGSRENITNAAIKLGQAQENITEIKMVVKGQNITIELPKTNAERDLKVNLIGYKKNSYNGPNSITSLKALKPWNGQKREETISISDMAADGFALLAQDGKTAKIYAAGKVEK